MATFSVTDRQTFLRCRQKWDFASNTRLNLMAIGSGPEPLELGSLIHRTLADWIQEYRENPNQTFPSTYLASVFLTNASQRQDEITKKFEATTKRKIQPFHMETLHNVVELGTHMMYNYQSYHQTPIPEHMRFAFPEQEIIVPVKGTEHACPLCENYNQQHRILSFGCETNIQPARPDCEECAGTGTAYHKLSGTLDGLLQDKKDLLYVLEHKTYENRPDLSSLDMNDQFTGYAWIVRELGIGKVAGIAYDGMWKRAKPPKHLQKEKRAATIDDLFIRKVLPKRKATLDAWGSNLPLLLNDMANNPSIYPHVPWQGCGDCDFIMPCQMKMTGENPTFHIKNNFTQREIIRGGHVKVEA